LTVSDPLRLTAQGLRVTRQDRETDLALFAGWPLSK
jgi:hypothetical protein